MFNSIFGTDNKKEKVYVIGNGWGAYFFVKNLDKQKYIPIIIAPNKKVLNTPKLTNLVIDPDARVEFPNPYGDIILDQLENINPNDKILITKSGSKYEYKYVVMSIGSEPNDFGIPGVEENTFKFKTITDANIIREKLSSGINNNVFIVGSGITGIELGSKIGLKYNVKIIEGLGSILPGFNDKTKLIICDWIKKNQTNIQIDLNTMVKSIELNKINILSNNVANQYLFDNKKDLIIWTGGVRFCGFSKSTLYKSLNQITPIIKPRGIDVSEDFSIGFSTGIFCIGDMVGNMGPPSAQNARLQGEWLAKYFNSGFDKEYLKLNKFESVSKGKLVHMVSNTYLESEYYSGFIPGIIDKIIEWVN